MGGGQVSPHAKISIENPNLKTPYNYSDYLEQYFFCQEVTGTNWKISKIIHSNQISMNMCIIYIFVFKDEDSAFPEIRISKIK